MILMLKVFKICLFFFCLSIFGLIFVNVYTPSVHALNNSLISMSILPSDNMKLTPVIVQIFEPQDGAIFTMSPDKNAGMSAKVNYRVQVDAAAYIERVNFQAIRTDLDPQKTVYQFDLYTPPDPIEPGYQPPTNSVVREGTLNFAAGQWKIHITATDENGKSGSAVVHFTVQSSSALNPGPASIISVTPLQASLSVLLRERSGAEEAIYTADSEIVVWGNNFLKNDFLEVFVSPMGRIPDTHYLPDYGLPTWEWVFYQAEILLKGHNLEKGQDFIKVRIPKIPETTPLKSYAGSLFDDSSKIQWRIVVKDSWNRPERISIGDDIYKVYPDPYKSQELREPAFKFVKPPYPLLYGFGFKNVGHETNLDEFLSSYGNNAYICLGGAGICAARVPDPIYWGLWYPIYRYWINHASGSCIGMSATSMLFYKGFLDSTQFDRRVYYPAGFLYSDWPARYDKSWLCPEADYPRPVNLWAHIRANHGAQTSAEFVAAVLRQLDFSGGNLIGDPVARYREINTNPNDYIIDMIPELGRGHGVNPFLVESDQISIYDCNLPNTTRYIDIDKQNNLFSLIMASEENWRGKGIFNIPLSVWRNSRTMPGLNDIDDYLWIMVAGEADSLYQSGSGSWGWKKDGSFVSQMPGAFALLPSGTSLNDIRTAGLVFPKAVSALSVQVNSCRGDYIFHAAQKGRIFQLEVLNSLKNETDNIKMNYANNLPVSVQYNTKGTAKKILPRIAAVPGDRQRVVYKWAGITVEDGSVDFKILDNLKGVQYENNSSKNTSHMLVVDIVDGLSSTASTYVFGPFDIPAGAVHKTSLKSWPASNLIISEVDLNNDGKADIIEEIGGTKCKALLSEQTDNNKDGIPDQFKAENGLAAEFRIGSMSYKVDGEQRFMDAAPYIKDSRTFLPVRFVAYACGVSEKDIIWEPASQTVTLKKGDIQLKLIIGDTIMSGSIPANIGLKIQMDTAPEVSQNRTMLPVRWIAEQFGYDVTWDPATQTVGLRLK
jgi:hypothetical protein